MRQITRRTSAVLAAAVTVSLAVAACGDDASEDAGNGSNDDAASAPQEDESGDDSSDISDDEGEASDDESREGEAMAGPVGPGCADYAEAVPDGPGSVDGMAEDPVATAASNNPLLTTLVSAVSGELNPDVDLVDTLNGDEFTVFAPVDDAFAEVDDETLDALSEDADLLTTVLTYHVVPGQVPPDEIAGEHETVQGESVTVEGSPDMLTVNDADVICGGVQTANATVYLIDAVLMPPME
ncbi:fasciclin domain-containing protein [Actinobacteria bacterium YIM 96077]|uniref:Fasciclin domain-containing protein n=1 Tax=Phytoactinopolyspora halophila TaxID=1981511 RepID=A0A329QJG2_9ACTN|nr:fasciclin domain-containing protein [Phytoactinopolyspora halophila]AYY15344.1 fasciclin domain-containing protein [Actinobacteria bacterium YIM 96077]RAW10628.1 fasciclin domain-containing protein [Phytoactinopolyspora halophila]